MGSGLSTTSGRAADLETLHRVGYVVVEGAVAPEVLDDVGAALDRFKARNRRSIARNVDEAGRLRRSSTCTSSSTSWPRCSAPAPPSTGATPVLFDPGKAMPDTPPWKLYDHRDRRIARFREVDFAHEYQEPVALLQSPDDGLVRRLATTLRRARRRDRATAP